MGGADRETKQILVRTKRDIRRGDFFRDIEAVHSGSGTDGESANDDGYESDFITDEVMSEDDCVSRYAIDRMSDIEYSSSTICA